MSLRVGSRTVVNVQLGKIPAPAAPVAPVVAMTPENDFVSKPPAGARMAIELASPVEGKLRDYIVENRKWDPIEMIGPNTHLGKTLAICGAGPSLADATPSVSAGIKGVDDVWACNSAITWLLARGVNVTAAVGIDQTKGLLREWFTAPDVPYFVASTVDPTVVAHLRTFGRRVSFFHNYVACSADERELYCETWPPGFMVGQGLTVVSRVIGLAFWMGYERVDVYGADCAFAANDVTHANGEAATEAYHNPLIMQGEINGRMWRTRPDMLMDAVHLVRRVRESQGRIRLMGDTLPVALLGKPDGFLDQVCRTLPPGVRPPADDVEPTLEPKLVTSEVLEPLGMTTH